MGPHGLSSCPWGENHAESTPLQAVGRRRRRNQASGPPRAAVGNPLAAQGHLGIYNIIREPHTIINLNTSLLYLAQHLINSPLMPQQGQTKRFRAP